MILVEHFRTVSRGLFWNGSYGGVFYRKCHLELSTPPRVLALEIEQIDYAPAVGQRMVLERNSAWRPLSATEQAAIDEKLLRMAEQARAVWMT